MRMPTMQWKKFKDESSRGAAALEVALSMPALLLSLFGTVEFGRAFWIRHALANVAAEAARVGSKSSCPRPTQSEVMAATNNALLNAGLMPGLTQVSLTNAGGESGTDFIVDLSYDAEFPVLSQLMNLAGVSGGVLELSAHVEAENE